MLNKIKLPLQMARLPLPQLREILDQPLVKYTASAKFSQLRSFQISTILFIKMGL